jgi:hypothetical protein
VLGDVKPPASSPSGAGSPKHVIKAQAKSRLVAQHRHDTSAPRAEPPKSNVDLEHDFSFLPTGIEPPKEKLKPLRF